MRAVAVALLSVVHDDARNVGCRKVDVDKVRVAVVSVRVTPYVSADVVPVTIDAPGAREGCVFAVHEARGGHEAFQGSVAHVGVVARVAAAVAVRNALLKRVRAGVVVP